ncbi:HlyD family type I secretion periplasmic adaptor subunit [Pelagibius litoralis]|uniref:Membrane fusion protein (MFP) family protein n=1 Tax=Pelagibius litoralis TaxID=374515 RepID=A0A967KIJ7_9PROT|nr:HlyD family type I secretion periplasmic adaptor subunit [Pelagibius litoralis]NIA72361.1 HlyD family type I secretion periplasmic adaptor subunit [Pelagibius litoralis]
MTGRDIVDSLSGPPPRRRVPALSKDLRATFWFGISAILLFFVAGGGWTATAPLSGAAIAPGVVSPEGSRQTVQHLEGGIIREISVRDGDDVEAGDTLVILEDVAAQAESGILMNRLRTLAAGELRLEAERSGADSVAFSHFSLQDVADLDVQAVIAQQRDRFETRAANRRSRKAILAQQAAQLKQQIAGARRQLVGTRRQAELIREEIEVVEYLVRRGYGRKPRLLALQRGEAELIGTEGELVASIARSNEAIAEIELQILNVDTERIEEITSELADIRTSRIEVEKQIKESLDRLLRTEITAPVKGTIIDLRYKTTGGVIRPGEAVLDIVPTEDKLVVDARVAPTDIDDVQVGLEAYVVFPTYPQRHLLRIDGQVTHVAADALEDERSGEPYYLAKIEIHPDRLQSLAPEIQLTPGLPAEVFITTEDRTVLEYLLQPLLETFERSLREP